ncbi:PepSY domain-containing protein [Anaerotalea alkaliphila]|uniref:PepSY domain-containing protein n=1 Tax=Anaerotalea alkaliphila TaxID=2662126 RepID=A0A7X5HV71_9FIRM|nr:PepSY domain-containing protein [Anaerotalea alkaliphila]NDL67251.1 hypothetical protein [Anaerotalea alkaliphila]
MKNRTIKERLRRAVQAAPLDVFDKMKDMPVERMEVHDAITRQEPGKRKRASRSKPLGMSVAAASLALAFSLGWFLQYRTVDTLVYLDLNPSIQLAANRRDQVIGLEALNGEGARLVERVEYRRKTLAQVTGELLDILLLEGWIDSDNHTLLLSVRNKDQARGEERTKALNQVIGGVLRENRIDPVVLRQTMVEESDTVREFARTYGVSPGRMTFIRNLILLDPELAVEELAGLSLEGLLRLSKEQGLDIHSIVEWDEEEWDGSDSDRDEDDSDDGSAGAPGPAPAAPQRIGAEAARRIALGLADARIVDLELEEDDGVWYYEIDMEGGGFEYEIEIHAYTGEVLKFEKEEDD